MDQPGIKVITTNDTGDMSVIVALSLFESAEAENLTDTTGNNRHKTNIFKRLIFQRSCLFTLTCSFICTITAQCINNLSVIFNAIQYKLRKCILYR